VSDRNAISEVVDRNAISEVGLDVGLKPRVWKVYTRKRTKGVNDDVGKKNA
jgi:hypothetical protein